MELDLDISRSVSRILEGYNGERSIEPSALAYEDTGFVTLLDLTVVEPDGTAPAHWEAHVFHLTAHCSEHLKFHRTTHPELFEPFEDDEEEASLTAEGFAAVKEVFEDRYPGLDVIDDSDGYLRFEVSVATTNADQQLATFDADLDHTIMQLQNELDPGTFGHEYVFGIVAAKLAE